jgi:uncharacterized protein
MKLLHVCDLYMHRRWLEWLALQAPDFDVVAIAGGILDLDAPVHRIDQQMAAFRTWALNFPGKLVVCSGQHDVDTGSHRAAWLEALARDQVTVDRGVTEVKGWTIEAVPYGLVPVRKHDKGIAVSSLAPQSATTAGWRFEGVQSGNPDLDWLVRNARNGAPRVFLSGFVHTPTEWSAPVGEAWSFNPGRCHPSCPVPNHVVLDLEQGIAEWHGAGRSAVRSVAI